MVERESKFKAWDKEKKRMSKPFTFGSTFLQWNDGDVEMPTMFLAAKDRGIWLQFTGLIDKTGREIYEGDKLRYRRPYRTTQTHYGDNIPNGEYTEPMEPAIETVEGVVVFKDGMFTLDTEDGTLLTPLSWFDQYYDEQAIKDAISYGGSDIFDLNWNCDDGDLPYLLEEYKLATIDDLINYCSNMEVIGNIFEDGEEN